MYMCICITIIKDYSGDTKLYMDGKLVAVNVFGAGAMPALRVSGT
jgi:hypothetical protein